MNRLFCRCCVQAARSRNTSQEPMGNGSVHHPGSEQAGMGYPETYAMDDQSYTPMLTQLPENQNVDAKVSHVRLGSRQMDMLGHDHLP